MVESAHYDEAWKEALDTYFEPLLAFFFPSAHALIDWSQPIEFLDKELQQLLPASEVGKRIADKLVKVWSRSGQPLYIYIHIEIQSQEDEEFAERMFIYHYRIFDFYRSPIMSLAILGDENPTWRPQSYSHSLGGSQIHLEFPIVKLLDYESCWLELEQSDHPIAILVMAHLRTKSTTGDPIGRKRWKWILTRRLYERGYERQEIVKLFRMIEWMMTLPPDLSQEFRQELDELEESQNMPLLSSYERIAREKGIEIGEQRGIETTKQQAVLNFHNLGLPIDQIAQGLELDPETVKQILSSDPREDSKS